MSSFNLNFNSVGSTLSFIKRKTNKQPNTATCCKTGNVIKCRKHTAKTEKRTEMHVLRKKKRGSCFLHFFLNAQHLFSNWWRCFLHFLVFYLSECFRKLQHIELSGPLYLSIISIKLYSSQYIIETWLWQLCSASLPILRSLKSILPIGHHCDICKTLDWTPEPANMVNFFSIFYDELWYFCHCKTFLELRKPM